MRARLTDSQVRGAKPAAKLFKLFDGGGLFLLVKPNGAKLWRYKYRLGKTENLFAVGQYPETGIQKARELHADARKLVEQGIHPAVQKRANRLVASTAAANTFEAVAQEWIDESKVHWTPYYQSQVETILGSYVFPQIGGLPVRSVTAAQLLAIVKKVAKKGDSGRPAPTVAILIRQWCSGIFRYAVATLRADSDPAGALKGAIRRPPVKHKTALSKESIRTLQQRIEGGGSTREVKIALRLLLLTFVRPGELRNALWSEFDLDVAQWRIPAERMKMRREHVVPLSSQAVELLRELRMNARHQQLFPNERDSKRNMSITTMNRSLERLGYAGVFSAHGFRATASTLLNEMGYRPDVIERQLAHQERNSVRRSYNHAIYLAERKAMMQDWADLLDGRESEATNVVSIRTA